MKSICKKCGSEFEDTFAELFGASCDWCGDCTEKERQAASKVVDLDQKREKEEHEKDPDGNVWPQ